MSGAASTRRAVIARVAPALLAALAGGCDAPPALDVYAAASLGDALREVVAVYEREAGVEVRLNLRGSGDLARQILAARRADVFFSAGRAEMERVAAAGLVVPGSERALLTNRLAVIAAPDAPAVLARPFAPEALLDASIGRVSIAHPGIVPAGRYAREWLERAGVWARLEARIAPAVHARAALAAVESGAAPVGIVYASDAAASARVRLVHVVAGELAPRIEYPCAALRGGDERRALDFVAFLAGARARAVFRAHGFAPAGAEER